MQALRRAGYPVVALTFPKNTVLSTYMQFMHYVVFGLGYLREMNFVTQPSVELYKAITSRLHGAGGGELIEQSAAHRYGRGVTLDTRFTTAPAGDAPAALALLLAGQFGTGKTSYGEMSFFGDTRYAPAGRVVRKALDRGASLLFRGLLKAPVDVYEGPAMNHSYHEMIIGHGHCFSIVLVSEKSEKIDRLAYDGGYHRSQFLATQMALAERERTVVSIVLKDLETRTITELEGFFRETAQCLKDLLKRARLNPHG